MSEVKLKFTADTAQALNGINKVKTGLNDVKMKAMNFGSGLKAGFNGVTGAIAGITAGIAGITLATAGFAKGLKSVIDLSGTLKDTSDLTGLSIKKVSELRMEFKNAGIDAGKTNQILAKFSNKIQDPSSDAKNWLTALGLPLKELQNLSLDKQFEAVRNSIASIGDESQRLHAVSVLFGEKNSLLANMFGDETSRANAKKFLGELPAVMNAIGPSLEPVGDVLDNLDVKRDQFFAGVGLELLKPITEGANKLAALDLTELGQHVGAFLRDLINAFKSGDIWGLIVPGLITALTKLAQELVTFFAYVFYQGFSLAAEKLSKTKQFGPMMKAIGYSPSSIPTVHTSKLQSAIASMGWIGAWAAKTKPNPLYNQTHNDIMNKRLTYGEFRSQSNSMMDGAFNILPFAVAGGKTGEGISKGLKASGGFQGLKDFFGAIFKGSPAHGLEKGIGLDIFTKEYATHRGLMGKLFNISASDALAGGASGFKFGPLAWLTAGISLKNIGKGILDEAFPGITTRYKTAGEYGDDDTSFFGPMDKFLPKDRYKESLPLDIQMYLEQSRREYGDEINKIIRPDYTDPNSIPLLGSIAETYGAGKLGKLSSFIPNLTSLGKKGGAVGELGQNAMVSFQKESLKHQASLDVTVKSMYDFFREAQYSQSLAPATFN